MKKLLSLIIGLLVAGASLTAQTLTTVTGKRIYDHHSSSLSNGGFYGYYNVPLKSGYDFVNHTNISSSLSATINVAKRDLVEHNGYFGDGLTFGFTNDVSNIGGFNYKGNNITKFYLNPAASFASLNTVDDLIDAYDPTATTSFDENVVVGNIYIIRVRHSDMYVAMEITAVSNLTPVQVTALDNGQQIIADVYFEFKYKYGTYGATYTGINEPDTKDQANAINVYPSPASQELFLCSNTVFKNYKIINITGSEAMAGVAPLPGGSIHIQSLEKGIYFLELCNETGVLQRSRFIKE